MNREIKFRAWSGINKEMVYPQSLPDNLGISNLTSAQILSRFDEEHIMQFTGIKDKSGKEIYEGDILRDGMTGIDYKVVIVVCKKFAFCGWYLSPVDSAYQERPLTTEDGTNTMIYMRIRGNIYENTELLNTTPNDNNP